ncbi:MAG: ABC transporter permease [Pirellulales bacterium]
MKTPLGLYNLRHQGARTAVSVGGVGFALLLVFMQLGFQGAVSHTAVNVYDHVEFDLVIRDADYMHLYEPGTVAKRNLDAAAADEDVQEVVPFWIGLQNWRTMPPENPNPAENPKQGSSDDSRSQPSGFRTQFLPLAIMGVEPGRRVFDLPEINEKQSMLTGDNRILVDDSTRKDYGPRNGKKFDDDDAGRETEVGGQSVRIVGVFRLGTGLAANAALLTSNQGFDRLVPWDASQQPSMGLVRLKPGADPLTTAERLRERIGKASLQDRAASVEILTKQAIIDWERTRWLRQTPIGLIFQLGVALSLLVGAAIVYMVLATDVADRLSEYATLLAMGYSHRYLCAVVLSQATALGIAGFAGAWLVSEILYRVTEQASGIPISMNMGRVVGVALLGLIVCAGGGTLALRKLWKAEPANLF